MLTDLEELGVLAPFLLLVAAVLALPVTSLLLRRYRPDIPQPFTMVLYPWPAVLSGALWLFIFFTGMYINLESDHILRNLRRCTRLNQIHGHSIPKSQSSNRAAYTGI